MIFSRARPAGACYDFFSQARPAGEHVMIFFAGPAGGGACYIFSQARPADGGACYDFSRMGPGPDSFFAGQDEGAGLASFRKVFEGKCCSAEPILARSPDWAI